MHHYIVEEYWLDSVWVQIFKSCRIFVFSATSLTDGIFETGAYGVPSKSQNPTVLGQGDLSIMYPMFKP